MLKRAFALLMTLCLALAAVGPAAAEAQNASFYLQSYSASAPAEDKRVTGGTALGDTLYIMTGSTLESWKPGEAEPTVLADAVVNADYISPDESDKAESTGDAVYNRLLAYGNALYGLNLNDGKLWKLVDETGYLAKPVAQTPLAWDKVSRTSTDGDYTYVPQFNDFAVVGQTLYACAVDWNNSDPAYEVFGWALDTGAMTLHRTDLALRTMDAYRDGLLIGKQYDDTKSWDEATQTQLMPNLITLDPATGETKTLFAFEGADIYGVRYNAANDTLYYVNGSSVYSMAGLQQPAKLSAYLPNRVWEDARICLLDGNMYAVMDSNGVVVRGLDMPGIENGALTIYGEYGSAGHQAYLKAYPQALVTCSEDYYNDLEEFTNAMVAGTNAVDVLRLSTDYSPFTRLVEKGYALDLSPYPELTAAVQAMDPNLTRLCYQDGKLYGVPVEMYANCFGYNTEAWKSLGLTEDDLPKTMLDVLDFLQNWQADYGEEHTDLMPLDVGDLRTTVMDWILTAYVAQSDAKGEALSFDTELFRKLLTAMEAIDFTELQPEDSNADSDYWNRTPVMSVYMTATYPGQYRYNTMQLLPLPIDEGMDPVLPVSLQLFIINPRTTHLDQAVQYLTTYVQNLAPESEGITLYPDHNDPVVNQSFESDLKGWKDSVETVTKQLETAKPEEKASLQNDLDYLNKLIANADDDRYLVSAKAIEQYRTQIAPWLVVGDQSPLKVWGKDGSNEFSTLENQYMDGAITLDTFVKEMDKRIRMMQLEDQ